MIPLQPGKPHHDAPHSALFMCSMNAIRSPIASAITRTLYPYRIYTRSAGIRIGENDPFVATIMNEMSVDISTHYPHTLDELEDQSFDIIITLTEEARNHAEAHPATSTSEVKFWPIPDPTLETGKREQRLNAYRSVRDMLIVRIKEQFGWHV